CLVWFFVVIKLYHISGRNSSRFYNKNEIPETFSVQDYLTFEKYENSNADVLLKRNKKTAFIYFANFTAPIAEDTGQPWLAGVRRSIRS
ncbi:MAG: hypothetical protein K6C12_02355, partial [Oscillospiraceae bacterium]|nr:hypothetical protein [Oscillospiraceae bacterium]